MVLEQVQVGHARGGHGAEAGPQGCGTREGLWLRRPVDCVCRAREGDRRARLLRAARAGSE